MIHLPELVERFNRQLERARSEGVFEPTAFALATSGADGRPAVRTMLLKEASESGFVFYTNFESRKGRELRDARRAAMCFWWGPLYEQVRIEGRVERVSEEEADAYFATRPRGSQIGAWASRQSEPLGTRDELMAAFAEYEAQFRDREVPRPPYWSGYRLIPDRIEFWYGREDRLHERFEYRLEGSIWTERILSP
jgi:pyridoxamine 5'-phosphate oxidase